MMLSLRLGVCKNALASLFHNLVTDLRKHRFKQMVISEITNLSLKDPARRCQRKGNALCFLQIHRIMH